MKCSSYVIGDWQDHMEYPRPCHCPSCGGFLKMERKWETGELDPKCNKCKTELIMLPEVDEETGDELEWGKICPISHPHVPKEKVGIT